jgi:hypothetical protein
MGTYTVTSNDTLTLNSHVFVDQAFGDISKITFPNELVNLKTGKNGNTVFAQNASGFNANLELRLLRGSTDDQFLDALILAPGSSFPSTTLLSGTFVKMLGDGQGNVVSDTYTLSGGVISKEIEGKENVEGDTEQAVATYMVKFASAARVIS